MKKKAKKEKSYYRWIEVTDFGLVPRKHGEYSNKQERIMGKAVKAKITLLIN